jgi:hypothetical protein
MWGQFTVERKVAGHILRAAGKLRGARRDAAARCFARGRLIQADE